MKINVSFLFLNPIQISHWLSSGPPYKSSRNTGIASRPAVASESSETAFFLSAEYENPLDSSLTYDPFNGTLNSTDSACLNEL